MMLNFSFVIPGTAACGRSAECRYPWHPIRPSDFQQLSLTVHIETQRQSHVMHRVNRLSHSTNAQSYLDRTSQLQVPRPTSFNTDCAESPSFLIQVSGLNHPNTRNLYDPEHSTRLLQHDRRSKVHLWYKCMARVSYFSTRVSALRVTAEGNIHGEAPYFGSLQ